MCPLNCEIPLGNSSSDALINCVRFQSHRDGSSLVSAGIVEIPVQHDGHGNQMHQLLVIELEDRHRSRPLAACAVGSDLRLSRCGPKKGESREQSGYSKAASGITIAAFKRSSIHESQ